MQTERIPTRVHIIGLPGSGKSTLAALIGRQLGVPPFDLDSVANADWDSCRDAASAIAKTPAWVTEGIYCGWTAPLFDTADLIVWLDVPPRVAVWRIVRRHAYRSLAGDNPHKGLRLLARFCGDVLRDPKRPAATDADLRAHVGANSRATTEKRLAEHAGKVAHCRRSGDTERVLRTLK